MIYFTNFFLCIFISQICCNKQKKKKKKKNHKSQLIKPLKAMVPELVVSSAAQTFFFGWCLVMQVLYACNGQDLKCVWATSAFLGFRVYHLMEWVKG
jgi:hypothetical protein